MRYKNLGHSGLKVSELSFGSWVTFGKQIENEVAEGLMKLAYDSGVNFFDNSEAYAAGRSEEVMGSILKKMGWSRDSYILSSKAFFGIKGLKESLPTQKGNNRKHLTEACHQALSRLQTEYLDLFFCHRPDKSTPIEETVWTMHNLIQQGKILYWGTSEWSAQEIMEAHMVARQNHLIGPTMEQPQYNMLHRDKMEVEFKQIFKNIGMGTTIWSPLASGLLTGKYRGDRPEGTRLDLDDLSWLNDRLTSGQMLERANAIADFAEELGTTPAKLSIAWCLRNPDVTTVILGASRVSQLEENLKAPEALDLLTDEVMEQIEQILQNKPKPPKF